MRAIEVIQISIIHIIALFSLHTCTCISSVFGGVFLLNHIGFDS